MNTPWHHLPMAAFDVETTGLDVESDRIITAALWRIDPARGTKEVATWFADPGIEIPAEAAEIHGITTEQARAQGRPAADVVTEIAAALDAVTAEGLPVVVYNAPYDLTLLDRELALHRPGAPLAAQPLVVDPLVLDKRVDTFRRGSRKLSTSAPTTRSPWPGRRRTGPPPTPWPRPGSPGGSPRPTPKSRRCPPWTCTPPRSSGRPNRPPASRSTCAAGTPKRWSTVPGRWSPPPPDPGRPGPATPPTGAERRWGRPGREETGAPDGVRARGGRGTRKREHPKVFPSFLCPLEDSNLRTRSGGRCSIP